MLRSLRFTVRRLQLSQRPPFFSTVASTSKTADNLDSISDKTSSVEVQLPPLSKFEEIFNATSCKDIHDVKEGGYVDLDAKDIATYFPEGMAGEMSEEFEFSGRTSWMVRDAGKLLCRLVEEFEVSKGIEFAKQGTNRGSLQGLSAPLNIPGLTDKPEWDDAKLRVFQYGTEFTTTEVKKEIGEKLVAVRGEGSVVEDVVKRLKTSSTGVPTKVMLTGNRGVGKSAALNQMVLHARKRGWLCLFVPKGWEQVQGGWYIEPVHGGKGTQTIYDNPFMSAAVLRGFWKAHSKQLKNIPITHKKNLKKYQAYLDRFKENWVRAKSMPGREKMKFMQLREIVEAEDHFPDQDELDADVLAKFEYDGDYKPTNLDELVLMGVAFRDLAGQVAMDLIEELKDLESVPVLVVVDQYNSWDVPSVYSYREKKVQSRELCVPHALSFISKKKAETDSWVLKNGICVAATSARHSEGRNVKYDDAKSSLSLVINVPCYSQTELFAATSYYTHQRIVSEGISTQELCTFRMYAGSNPWAVRTQSVGFFFPLAVAKHGEDFMRPYVPPGSSAAAQAEAAAAALSFDEVTGEAAGAGEIDAEFAEVVGDKKKKRRGA